jgi:hypothetical protein
MKKTLIIAVIAIIIFFNYFSFANGKLNRIYRISSSDQAQELGEKALASNDESICDRVTKHWWALGPLGIGPGKRELRNTCYGEIIDAYPTVSNCNKLTYSLSGGYDNCYEKIAKKTSKPDICYLITSRLLAGSCISDFLKTREDIKLCDNFPNQLTKDGCLLEYNRIFEIDAICSLIKETEANDICQTRTATRTKDVSICDKIKTEGVRNTCYINIVKSSKDKEICQKISNPYYRKDCLDYAAR